jgi:hypothetical protein
VLVSCDTAVAHLAGTLGLPVLLLLPFAADWRWGEGSTATGWYARHKLLRQERPGDWVGVIEEAARQLQKLARDPRSGHPD